MTEIDTRQSCLVPTKYTFVEIPDPTIEEMFDGVSFITDPKKVMDPDESLVAAARHVQAIARTQFEP